MQGRNMRKLMVILFLCSVVSAQNPYRTINRFNAGELSPLLSAREDLAKYQSGCSIMENLIPIPQGGAQKRPGTKYITEVKTSSLATRIIPFEFSTTQSYIIEVGNQYMRFYKDSSQIIYDNISFGANPSGDFAVGATMTGATSGATAIVVAKVSTQVYTIKYEQGSWTDGEVINCGGENVDCAGGFPTTATGTTPVEISTDFLTAELFDIQFTQSADVLYLVHSNHAPSKLLRYSHDYWKLEDIDFKGRPFLDDNTEEITITPPSPPTDVTSGETFSASDIESATYNADKAFDDISTGYNGWYTFGDVTNEWIKVQFGAQKTITKIRIQPCTLINYSVRNVRYCKLQGSNNDSDWTDISAIKWIGRCAVYNTDEIEIEQINNYTDWVEIEFTNSTAYTYYRLWCHSNWGNATRLGIKEIEMMESLGTTYTASSPIFTSEDVDTYWKIVHPIAQTITEASFSDVDDVTSNVTIQKGRGYDFTVTGTWDGTIALQKSYDTGTNWEDILTTSGGVNITNSGTEDDDDAIYRAKFVDDNSGTAVITFVARTINLDGIIKVYEYTDTTNVKAVVISSLGGTIATEEWAEGAWSDEKNYPQVVTFFEERLIFGNTTNQPDTIWGSVTGDYENMLEGADDDDAITFTLSSNRVNAIQWLIGKNKILIGTSGAEWTLAGSSDEPLTPSNVKAEQQSAYGSANLQATLANESILFFQRGAEKMRELAYNWESDSYVAPDMTILASFVADGGIVDTAFQKTPDSILWCVRNDGELPVFSYERNENVTAWSRMVTADSTGDSDFESVAVISGSPEDEVWVVVKRTMAGVNSGNPVRYIEQFQPRDFGSDADDAYYVDCGITYDDSATTTITGLTHLIGETVTVLADGAVQNSQVVDGSGEITITSASTVQVGLAYEVHLRTMPLSWVAEGMTIQGRMKRISEVIASWYKSGDFQVGRDTSTLETISISGQTTAQDRVTFPPGYDRDGYVYVYQRSPEPLTLLAVMIEFSVP